VKGQKTVGDGWISVGAKKTFTNNTEALLDLVVHVKGQFEARERRVRFTYTK
jgi:hypothetical protein